MTQDPGASAHRRPIDGRRQRTVNSRARIIAAMLELTQEGQISVSAELVAERANVGLRTVFRHFKDMDSLYREMSLTVEARLMRVVSSNFVATGWRDQLVELIHRRAGLFEMITPFKRAEAAHRHRSKWLADDNDRLNAFLRAVLRRVLPTSVRDDAILLEALDLVLSFESWDRLRREQRLSAQSAREVLEGTVAKLIIGATE